MVTLELIGLPFVTQPAVIIEARITVINRNAIFNLGFMVTEMAQQTEERRHLFDKAVHPRLAAKSAPAKGRAEELFDLEQTEYFRS